VQVTAGTGVELPFAVKPNWAVPPGASEPFQDTGLTVTFEPLGVNVPFHSDWIDCPAANVQVTVQPLIAVAPAVTVTVAWNPPCQKFVTWYAAVQAPRGGVVVVVVVVVVEDEGEALDRDGEAEDGAGDEGRGLAVVAVGVGNGAFSARLNASWGWKLPAPNAHPSASPGGLTQRNPSMLASPVFVVGYWPIRRSVLSSAHQSPAAPPLRLVSMIWCLPEIPDPLSAEMIARP
jgi:hypothetical protein